MECRIGCGACCIAPSISSALPLHPFGKPASVRCLHLDVDNKCLIFLLPSRPQVCHGFKATIIPLHPGGKPANVACLHLDDSNKCAIFLLPSRPRVCHGFQATEDACGSSRAEALSILSEWEILTGPSIR
ncbi:MAG: hypothetical protein ABL925_15895 [Methylococcales bacterium]